MSATEKTHRSAIKHIGIGAAVTSAAIGAGIFALGDAAFRTACDVCSPLFIKSNKRAIEEIGEQLKQQDNDEQRDAVQWFQATRQSLTTYSEDGLRLHAWVLDPDRLDPKPHLYAICCHGFCGEPQEMARYALRYARMGCTVLLPALRAHERSQGRYVGMGYLDRRDVMRWINLVVRGDPDAQIILHGNSMGAAAVMLAAGEPDFPAQVKAVIEDSGYPSVSSQMRYVTKSMLRLPRIVGLPMLGAMSVICRMHAGFGLTDGDCVRATSRIHVPMLCVHGTADQLVPHEFMDRIVSAYRGRHCLTLSVTGAGHTLSSVKDPDTYWRMVQSIVEEGLRIA